LFDWGPPTLSGHAAGEIMTGTVMPLRTS